MTRDETVRWLPVRTIVWMMALLLSPALVLAQSEDIAELQRQLEEQRAKIQAQQEQLNRQMQELERMEQRLNEMAGGMATAAPSSPVPTAEVGKPVVRPEERDNIGDLNREAIRAGDFPGSFQIPGPGKVSLGIGGFVKAVAIGDSAAENMGADFLPSTLGSRRADQDGAFSIDSTITRLFLDGRAPSRRGKLRGYVEADLNQSNDGSLGVKLRHAYGTWQTSRGTLTFGHTWSTFMDLNILPEGLTEPTLSGPIFSRQPQIRWSQPLGTPWTFHAAVEDPSSSDVFSSEPVQGRTTVPDVILGLEYKTPEYGFRFNSIVRDIKVNIPAGGEDRATGWGLTLTGHVNLFQHDRFRFSGVYGEGLGRYLLGIQSTDGATIDPADNQIALRNNWGALASYQHQWSDALRSTLMYGHAQSDPLGFQIDKILVHTDYFAANLMWKILPYLTLGGEYSYGVRENNDGSELDNHRVMFGFQVY